MPAKRTSLAKTNGKKAEAQQARNERASLAALSGVAVRASIAARLGKTFSDDRDLYVALGYTKAPSFNDYLARYHRQDIARAIIDKPVRASWAQPPLVTEGEQAESAFEKAWFDLANRLNIWRIFSRADRLAGIGSYSVLFLGLNDGGDFSVEATNGRELLYLTPFSEANATIDSYDTDKTSPRYGQPLSYKISLSIEEQEDDKKGAGTATHHSRVIHVAEDVLENDITGMPKLQAVLNRLQDLDLVAGGSAEMFWRGAFPGYGFMVDPEASVEGQDADDLKDEIEKYMHGLKRYLRLQGVSVQAIQQQVADPRNHVDVLIDLIAAATEMPKRILIGSERGELASSQDTKAWNDKIRSRRVEHCEQGILRPFIDRLIDLKVLPAPRDGYAVVWPDLESIEEDKQSEIAERKTKALKAYVETPGADQIIPPTIFMRDILGMSESQIDEATDIIDSEISLGSANPADWPDEENEVAEE